MITEAEAKADAEQASYERNYIKAWLYNEKCLVKFYKRDGSIREMYCTLKPELLPEQADWEEQQQRNSKSNSNSHVVVWDMEKNDWRCFKFDTVIDFTPVYPRSDDFTF